MYGRDLARPYILLGEHHPTHFVLRMTGMGSPLHLIIV